MGNDEVRYQIESTSPQTFFDGGAVVEGHIVRFRIFEFDEVHTLNITDFNVDAIAVVIDAFIDVREAVAKLG